MIVSGNKEERVRQAKNIERQRQLYKRVMYWEEILEVSLEKFLEIDMPLLGEEPPKYNINDLNDYVKINYAEKLKEPEVIARILGLKQENE